MPLSIIIIDNYDSFTYNLVHLFESEKVKTKVVKTNQINFSEIQKKDAFVISPGPGIPNNYKKLMEAIRLFSTQKPILGICLGHQAIACHYGATLKPLNKLYHGTSSNIKIIDHNILFKKIKLEITVGRYHSWTVKEDKKNSKDLLITAIDKKKNIMALRHKIHPVFGVQFHPESIMTPEGSLIIQNFINYIKTSKLSLKT